MLDRRAFIATTAAFAATPALAQSAWPTQPVKIVVPFGPGGLADVTMRIVGEKLGQRLGQPILIDNKPGAGGAVAAVASLNARDGHTLSLLTNGSAVSAAFMTSLGFDPVKDFLPISSLGFFDFVVTTGADQTYKTLADIVAAAKAKPGSLTVGAINIGSTQHLSAVLFNQVAKLDATIVPYKTTPDAITAAMRKDVDIIIDGYSAVGKLIADGKLRALASTGAARSAVLPNVPTVAEQGFAGFDVTSWNALFAPKGTPDAVVARLSAEIAAAVAEPEVKAKLAALGIEAKASTPAEIGGKLAADIKRWNEVIDQAGVQRQ